MFFKFFKTLKKRQGFTLIELMIVVAIIGILVAIAIPVYNSSQTNAQKNANQANERTLIGALQQYAYAHGGDYPDTLQELAPEYIQAVPAHPFGSDAGGYEIVKPTGLDPLKVRSVNPEYHKYDLSP